MIKPAIPANEAQRLHVLHELKILDTLADDRFDRVTRIAARLFHVPMALISLVDSNRQWFKSRVGMHECSTRRDISFCAHALHEHDILLVEDAALDVRFHDNPLVTDYPYIRFYAGYPLKARDGMVVGTLCILDHQPRYLSSDEMALLTDLGHIVETELRIWCQSTTDLLTGLYNRAGFFQLAHNTLALCKRHEWQALLVYMDLNGFKRVNDTFGHEAGDEALRLFATLLHQSFRHEDVIARIGGDEFILLLPHCSEQEYVTILQRINEQLERLNALKPQWNIGVSCGMTPIYPDTRDTLEASIKKADACMYSSRRHPGDLSRVFYQV